MSLQVPVDPDLYWLQDQGYLVVLGGDIYDIQITGNIGYEITPESNLDAVSYHLEEYETPFSELVWELANEYDSWEKYDHSETSTRDNPVILYNGALKRIIASDYKIAHNDIGEVFGQVMSEISMLYWVFSVEIPPNGAVNVVAKYAKEASEDITGPRKSRDGYDLATKLGSNLHFSDQSASITNSHLITIVDQNFGFDLERGITHAILEIKKEERYYLMLL